MQSGSLPQITLDELWIQLDAFTGIFKCACPVSQRRTRSRSIRVEHGIRWVQSERLRVELGGFRELFGGKGRVGLSFECGGLKAEREEAKRGIDVAVRKHRRYKKRETWVS